MSLSTVRNRRKQQPIDASANYVVVSDSILSVSLNDGRTITVPLEWYPRLLAGTPAERNRWELSGQGTGIHWPDLDEDISVDGLISGRRSMETEKSFQRWLSYYRKGEKVPVPTLPLPNWAKSAMRK
jgi:hypothetical protein